MKRDAADDTENQGVRGDSLSHTNLQRLLRLWSAYLQAYQLRPTAYDAVRKPRRVLLVVTIAPENNGPPRQSRKSPAPAVAKGGPGDRGDVSTNPGTSPIFCGRDGGKGEMSRGGYS